MGTLKPRAQMKPEKCLGKSEKQAIRNFAKMDIMERTSLLMDIIDKDRKRSELLFMSLPIEERKDIVILSGFNPEIILLSADATPLVAQFGKESMWSLLLAEEYETILLECFTAEQILFCIDQLWITADQAYLQKITNTTSFLPMPQDRSPIHFWSEEDGIEIEYPKEIRELRQKAFDEITMPPKVIQDELALSILLGIKYSDNSSLVLSVLQSVGEKLIYGLLHKHCRYTGPSQSLLQPEPSDIDINASQRDEASLPYSYQDIDSFLELISETHPEMFRQICENLYYEKEPEWGLIYTQAYERNKKSWDSYPDDENEIFIETNN